MILVNIFLVVLSIILLFVSIKTYLRDKCIKLNQINRLTCLVLLMLFADLVFRVVKGSVNIVSFDTFFVVSFAIYTFMSGNINPVFKK